jgi:AraC-like DNA-binding protein
MTNKWVFCDITEVKKGQVFIENNIHEKNSVVEVIYDIGYTDTKAFRTMFKKITG